MFLRLNVDTERHFQHLKVSTVAKMQIVKLGSRPWPGPTQLNSPPQSLISDSKGLDLR